MAPGRRVKLRKPDHGCPVTRIAVAISVREGAEPYRAAGIYPVTV